jgi:DNA-binding beta-propeller fold protein YncE
VVVDDELDRLWATSPWGADVLAIPGGEVLARVWLGAAIRIAAIDRTHDLVFVPSTFTGRIWVLDRRSLELLGSVPVGVECRQVEVSADGRRLYASNALGYYAFDIDRIDRELRGKGS